MANASAEPVFVLPFWMRIGTACLMFMVTLLSMWRGFLRFEWVPYLCFGLYYLIYVPKQRAEAAAAYLKKSRTMAAGALMVAALAGFGHNLYVAFAK